MEKICELFKMDETKFLERKQKNTAFVKSYFDNTMKKDFRPLYWNYQGLNATQTEYLEFGADKCSVIDFRKFCEKLNIDVDNNLKRIKKEEERILCEIRNGMYNDEENLNRMLLKYHFYSRCKKITFTCQYPSNYMHYFGITGEAEAIINAFTVFLEMGKYEEMCFGYRIFI